MKTIKCKTCNNDMMFWIGDEFGEIYQCTGDMCFNIAIKNIEIYETIDYYKCITEVNE